jgi:hypothetical protein
MSKRALWPHCKVISAAAPVASAEDAVSANQLQAAVMRCVWSRFRTTAENKEAVCRGAEGTSKNASCCGSLPFVTAPEWLCCFLHPLLLASARNGATMAAETISESNYIFTCSRGALCA